MTSGSVYLILYTIQSPISSWITDTHFLAISLPQYPVREP